jgi:hypothetical protein
MNVRNKNILVILINNNKKKVWSFQDFRIWQHWLSRPRVKEDRSQKVKWQIIKFGPDFWKFPRLHSEFRIKNSVPRNMKQCVSQFIVPFADLLPIFLLAFQQNKDTNFFSWNWHVSKLFWLLKLFRNTW